MSNHEGLADVASAAMGTQNPFSAVPEDVPSVPGLV
jgi:hypothetical protein